MREICLWALHPRSRSSFKRPLEPHPSCPKSWPAEQPAGRAPAALTSPATKNRSGASSSLALYLAMIFSAIGWISCLAASDSPSSSESVMGRERHEKHWFVEQMERRPLRELGPGPKRPSGQPLNGNNFPWDTGLAPGYRGRVRSACAPLHHAPAATTHLIECH